MTRSPAVYARTAGALYLVTHVTSVTAVVAYGAGALRVGVLLEYVLALGCVGTGILLALLLRAYGPARALTFAMLRAVEASVILAGTLPMLAQALGGTSDARLDDAHTASFLIGQGLVISVNTIVLGWLLFDARVVPRPLAVLGLAGGALVLASNLCQLLDVIPLNGTVAGICAVPVFAFEIWLALHLLVRTGARVEQSVPAR